MDNKFDGLLFKESLAYSFWWLKKKKYYSTHKLLSRNYLDYCFIYDEAFQIS